MSNTTNDWPAECCGKPLTTATSTPRPGFHVQTRSCSDCGRNYRQVDNADELAAIEREQANAPTSSGADGEAATGSPANDKRADTPGRRSNRRGNKTNTQGANG